MEVRGEGERHHRRLPALSRYSHGGLRGGGDPWRGKKKKEKSTHERFLRILLDSNQLSAVN